MTAQLTPQEAFDVASNFLARESIWIQSFPFTDMESFPSNVGQCSAIFWWDSDTPLFEFPLYGKNMIDEKGYVIVSSDRLLPPIMEFAYEGATFSKQLSGYLNNGLTSLNLLPQSIKWIYWNALELTAQVSIRGQKGIAFFAMPNFEQQVFTEEVTIKRDKIKIWPQEEIRKLWHGLENWREELDKLSKSELRISPVKYQQGCDKYKKSKDFVSALKDGNTYCSPNCISGCTCVAWAVLASAWKRKGYTQIWPNSKCWDLDWPSSTNPNRCQEVSNSIWEFHRLMETTCGGSTNRSISIRGGEHFKGWGLNWKWADWDNIGINEAMRIINAGQPFLFSATGEWKSYFKIKKSGGSGKVGHSIVCYGYDTGNNTIKICLGWGSSFSDRWIALASYQSNKAIFVTSFSGKRSKSDSIKPASTFSIK
jgi:hypothetical protein